MVDNAAPKTLDELKYLPPLKSTVHIVDGGFDHWHEKVWILTEHLTNKLYYLGRFEYEIMSRWNRGTLDELVERVNNETIVKIERADVEKIIRFLLVNNLLQVGSDTIGKIKAANKNYFQLFVQNVGKLFSLRIHLINPDKFLIKTKEWVRPLFSPTFFYIIVVLLLVNIYLLASNWSSFTDSIPSFTSFSSVVLILVTMAFTKIVHELGHAYACRLAGCKVPEMGVIFIFFYPLLYTDVSSSMILPPKQRLLVATAGIRLELYLAVIAGVLWFFVPEDSIFKNLLFFVAAISWVISITINVIPFMRFDGYYILSDYLHIRNLGPRASAIFKYYFRTYLFGLDSVLPENYNPKKYKFFLIFSILVGLYKISLFTSILLLLYYTELVGWPLFFMGLFMFILLPAIKEMYNIWQLRESMKTPNNVTITAIIFVIALAAIFTPIRNNTYMPAVLLANTERIYTPFAARVEGVMARLNMDVKKNTKLLELSSPKLTTDQFVNKINLETEQYYSVGVMLDDQTRQKRMTEQSNIEYQKTVQANLDLKSQRLKVVAPFDGKVTAIKNQLYTNTWLEKDSWLLDLVDFKTFYLQAFVTAEDIQGLQLESKEAMSFIPDRYDLPGCDVKLKSISQQPIGRIPMQPFLPLSLARSTIVNSNLLFFSSEFGGAVNLITDDEQNWVPVESFFTMEFTPQANCTYTNLQIIKGVVKIRGENKSLAKSLYVKVKNMFQKRA